MQLARSLVPFYLALLYMENPQILAAQAFSPYSDFESMTLQQLSTLQVKLTYVGPQLAALPTLAFTSNLNVVSVDAFTPFYRPNINYVNDTIKVRSFTATPQELEAVIDNVGTLPDVRAGGVAEPHFLSFSMVNTQPMLKGFEAILNKSQSNELFAELRESLATNKEGLKKISEMACALDLLEPARPMDVSGSVMVKFTGLRPDRHTGFFVNSVSVTNNSGSTLPAPVSLVLDLPGTVGLVGADGTTCGTNPVGRQFIHLPIPATGLAPGATVTITLHFENPNKEPIAPNTFKVLAGPGAR